MSAVYTVEQLNLIAELGLALSDEFIEFRVMLLHDISDKLFEAVVETRSKRVVAAELRELPIDSPDDLNIVMFDELQVIFFVFF